MFWGLVLKANRKYTQKTSKSFHISQAVLDVNSSGTGSNQLFITYEDQKYLICDLNKDKTVQVPLDLNFASGDEICFQSQGNGCIYLTGYLTDLPDNSMFSDDDDDDEEIESEVENEDLKVSDQSANNEHGKSKKNKGGVKTNIKAAAAAVTANKDDDSEEDDSDDDLDGLLDDEDDSDDENDAEEGDEGDDSDEEVESPKPKLMKLDKQAKQNGVADKNKDAAKKDKKNKKEKKQENAQKQQNNSGEKTIQGGVKIQDIVVGSGAEAKPGKKAQVFYEGRLKQNNKVFDSVKQGAGFKFNVGRGDVIKGWDIGVVGMKVGGKRRITCPPHMAYGARGMPPQIPPNSTLVFEVELKGA